MIERVQKALLKRIRQTLTDGSAVGIVGWRHSNHDQFTRGLPKDKVVFIGAEPVTLPECVGYVVLTRFVSHSAVARIRKQRPCHAVPIDIGTIKQLLKACADLFAPKLNITTEKALPVAQAHHEQSSSRLDLHLEILDYLTKPKKELSLMENFTAAFLLEAAKNNGMVSMHTLGELRRKHEITDSATRLTRKGWLIAKIGNGKQKIGWYLPGEKMQAVSEHLEPEPEDPLDRAKHMIAQKESILAEKVTLVSQVAALDEKLKRIEQAERLLQALEELIKLNEV